MSNRQAAAPDLEAERLRGLRRTQFQDQRLRLLDSIVSDKKKELAHLHEALAAVQAEVELHEANARAGRIHHLSLCEVADRKSKIAQLQSAIGRCDAELARSVEIVERAKVSP